MPIKIWAQRFAFLFLVTSAFTLMLLSKAETVLIEHSRTAVVDAVTPVLAVLSQPVQSVSSAIEEVNGLFLLNADNARLKRENELLLGWQNEARRLQLELNALRSQLAIVPDPIPRTIGARVIGDSSGAFVNSVIVNAGTQERIVRGQAAVTVDGLVGRVAAVGRRSARILLLTDLNSRVPVVVESTGDRAILAGNNSPRPDLLYLSPNTPLIPGSRLLTSGHGGVFPPGLAVGIVAEVTETGITVQPLADYARLSYVQVLDYGPDGILPAPGANDLAVLGPHLPTPPVADEPGILSAGAQPVAPDTPAATTAAVADTVQ
ncbi:MAG: rod shape-determining protein MreC [Alphaproteobacteria bacterium]